MLPIRASRIVHVSRRRALPSLASVRHSRRSVQLSLPRARRSPSLIRPNLFNGRVSSLLLVRFSIRLLTRLSSQLPVRRSPLAALVLSSRLLRNAHRLLNRSLMRIALMARTAWLPRRVRATTRMLAVAFKRKAPRCP